MVLVQPIVSRMGLAAFPSEQLAPAAHRSQGISLPQQLRKLRNIRRDAPRLVAGNCWIQRAVREVRSGSATSRGRG